MNQIRLQNLIGKTSLVGQIVKLAPNSTTAYVLADLTDHEAIGTVAESVPYRYWGLVNLINTVTWDDITGKPNVGTREVTDDTTELTTDCTILCNKATAMSVSLLPATGSQRIVEIDNKGVGAVTVYPYADPSDPSPVDTIEGETSQIVRTNCCMVIKDVAVGEWRII